MKKTREQSGLLVKAIVIIATVCATFALGGCISRDGVRVGPVTLSK